jgi:predicted CoA-binding protein
MVIGASRDRAKFGNKAVRAYLRQGHTVLPINPHAPEIEGVPAFAEVGGPPGPIDRAVVYLHAEQAIPMLRALAARGDVGEVWLNPGADDPEVVDLAESLGLNPVQACAILDIGESPHSM